MGILHEYGYGIAEDKENANKYYQKALPLLEDSVKERQDPRAQYRLAVYYEYGLGETKKDRERAAAYDLAAANQGHWLAQYRYGLYLRDVNDYGGG